MWMAAFLLKFMLKTAPPIPRYPQTNYTPPFHFPHMKQYTHRPLYKVHLDSTRLDPLFPPELP